MCVLVICVSVCVCVCKVCVCVKYVCVGNIYVCERVNKRERGRKSERVREIKSEREK